MLPGMSGFRMVVGQWGSRVGDIPMTKFEAPLKAEIVCCMKGNINETKQYIARVSVYHRQPFYGQSAIISRWNPFLSLRLDFSRVKPVLNP